MLNHPRPLQALMAWLFSCWQPGMSSAEPSAKSIPSMTMPMEEAILNGRLPPTSQQEPEDHSRMCCMTPMAKSFVVLLVLIVSILAATLPLSNVTDSVKISVAHSVMDSFDSLLKGQKPHLLCIGNPGVGKSSILNSLAGEIIFDAGTVLDGTGRTKGLNIANRSGMLYMDTPGLEDLDLREKAAKDITQALKVEGAYKVFFVITLNSGRIRPEDVTTMKLVLQAAPITDYGIIVNKVEREIANRLRANASQFDALKFRLTGGLPYKTKHMYMIDWIEDLAGKDNKMLEDLSFNFRAFVRSTPSVEIDAKKVHEIQIKDFEKLIQEYEKKLSLLQHDDQVLEKKMDIIEKQLAQSGRCWFR